MLLEKNLKKDGVHEAGLLFVRYFFENIYRIAERKPNGRYFLKRRCLNLFMAQRFHFSKKKTNVVLRLLSDAGLIEKRNRGLFFYDWE